MKRSSKIASTMKSPIVTLMAIFVVIIQITHASAAEKGIQTSSVLKFLAGLSAGFSVHEGAHAIVAGLTDTDLTWEIGNYNQPLAFSENATSDAKGAAIYSAGLLSQVIGSEVILQVEKVDKNDAFVRGMMTWNIINPILYALDYQFFRVTNKEYGNTYQGDLEGIEHYTDEPTAQWFALSMVAISAYQGYRFLKTQTWAPDWLKGVSQSVNLVPMPSAIAVTYTIQF